MSHELCRAADAAVATILSVPSICAHSFDIEDEVLDNPPSFSFAQVRNVVEEFSRNVKIEARDSATRLVGLAMHLLYWNILRVELLNEDDEITDIERSELFSATLACFSEADDETEKTPLLLLCVHCSIERLFRGAYSEFFASSSGKNILCSFHRHLRNLFDPHRYHTDYLALHHNRIIVSHLTTDKVARTISRTRATSPMLNVKALNTRQRIATTTRKTKVMSSEDYHSSLDRLRGVADNNKNPPPLSSKELSYLSTLYNSDEASRRI